MICLAYERGVNMTNEDKYNAILSYEQRTSWKVTSKVVEKPELSVWMILIPIIFVPYMQRYQKYKETSKEFSEGYLFTKRIALDAAYKIHSKEMSKGEAIASAIKVVNTNPNADARVLNIYEKQINEIELLCQHYVSLLSSVGVNYEQLVVNRYKSYDNYFNFVTQLIQAEKDVSRAATQTFKADEDTEEVPGIIEKMEKCLAELRLEEARQLFT